MPDVRDLKLTAAGDLDVTGGDLQLTYDGPGSTVEQRKDARAQHLRQRLKLVLGEWFIDEDAGTDWFGQVIGQKNPNLAVVRALIEERVLGTPGIASVSRLDMDLDRTTRELSIALRAVTTEGDVLDLDTTIGG